MRQLLIACLLLLVGSVVAGARAEELQRSVTVSAQSEIVVKPDEVLIDFVVSSQHKELLAARSTNDQVTESVFQITHQLELTPENVKVTDLEVSPVRDRYGSLVGYSVGRSITVRIHRFSIIEDFIAGLLDAGVTDIERLKFQVRDQRPHQREARRLAFEYAREKATHLAELSGLVLGDVITVDEDVQHNEDSGGGGGMGGFGGFGGVSSVSPRPSDDAVVATSGSDAAPRAEQSVFRTVAFQEQTPKTSEAGPDDTKLLAPGVARLNATVTVKFELRKPRAETDAPSRRP